MTGMYRSLATAAMIATMMCAFCAGQNATGWPVYNGGLDGDHYSQLKQITRANVKDLKMAWSFETLSSLMTMSAGVLRPTRRARFVASSGYFLPASTCFKI